MLRDKERVDVEDIELEIIHFKKEMGDL